MYCAVNASMSGCIHFLCKTYVIFHCTFRGSKKSFAKWTKIEFNLKSRQNNTNSRLQFTTSKSGVIWLDQVSVMPLDTYMVSYCIHYCFYILYFLVRTYSLVVGVTYLLIYFNWPSYIRLELISNAYFPPT